MRERGFGRGLLGLALIVMMSAGPVQKSWSEGKAAAHSAPSGWTRVDGQDHDLDEMLSLFRPKGAETLAVFAPPQAWKPFYQKVYGRNPIDLALYATIYRLSPDGPDSPNLGDWPSFYQDGETLGPNQPPPGGGIRENSQPLGPPSPTAVTFRASLAPAAENDRQDPQDEDAGTKTAYRVITSLILNRQEVLFLNLFHQDGQDDFDELEGLALAWRADFLETYVQPEEEREQDLE